MADAPLSSSVTQLTEQQHIDYDVTTISLTLDSKPIRNLEAL
jgi:hypothetical protein